MILEAEEKIIKNLQVLPNYFPIGGNFVTEAYLPEKARDSYLIHLFEVEPTPVRELSGNTVTAGLSWLFLSGDTVFIRHRKNRIGSRKGTFLPFPATRSILLPRSAEIRRCG